MRRLALHYRQQSKASLELQNLLEPRVDTSTGFAMYALVVLIGAPVVFPRFLKAISKMAGLLIGANHMINAAPPSPAIQPRGMDIRQAAKYFGCSPGTFKKLVRLGLAPAPLKLPGIDRHIFDREAIDKAMSARAAGHGGV